MAHRWLGILSISFLLLTTSGAALNLHEQLEHAAVASHQPLLAGKTPLHAADPEPADCLTCFQLTHLALLSLLIVFIVGLFGDVQMWGRGVVRWVDRVTFVSPRSSRGPPCLLAN